MENSSFKPGPTARPTPGSTPNGQAMGRVAAPARVLHTLLERGVTGHLRASYLSPAISNWSIYLAQGQIQFSTGHDPQGDRLAYLLQRSCRQLLPSSPKQLRRAAQAPYDYLHHCWKQEQISLQELRDLLRSASQEALVHFLSITQGRVLFERGVTPRPTLISSNLNELIEPLEQQVGQWQALNQRSLYPHSRLSLVRGTRFAEQFTGPIQALRRSQGRLDLQSLLAGQPSLYAIAAQLNADLLPMAQLMDQAAKLGYLRWQTQARVTPLKQSLAKGTIACLDSSNAVQQQVRQTLEPLGYRVVGLAHPQQALSILVKERPCLILMDGVLAAEADQGLGRILRESSLLSHIPLILLSSHDSLINPVRTKVARAQGWIVKPLEEASLLKTVQRWAMTRSPSPAQSVL